MFLAVLAAIVVAVWGIVFLLRGSLHAGCVLLLVVGATFGHPFFHFDLGPVPFTLDRLVLLLLVAAYVVQRALGKVDRKPLTWPDYALFAFLGMLTLSMLSSDWHTHQEGDVSAVWRLVGGYLIPATVYWIARQAPASDRQTTGMHLALAAYGLYLAVTGVLEVFQVWSLVFPAHIADPTIGLHFGRARGPMVHAVTYGHYLGVGFLACWLAGLRFEGARRWLLWCMLPVLAAGLYYSYTRSVWLGTGAGLAVVLALTLRGRLRAFALGAMCFTVLAFGLLKSDSILEFQREGTLADTRESVSMRGSFTYVSWLMFKDKPIFGFGFGRFPEDKLPYIADRTTDLNLESIRGYVHHNTYLSLLTETGLVGLSIYLAMVGGWCWNAWRICRNPNAPPWAYRQAALMLGGFCIYGAQLMFHELSYTPLDNSLAFYLAGATMALRPLASTSRTTVEVIRR